MGFTKKSHNRGMGFLLVFFPEEQQQQQQQTQPTKKNLLSPSSIPILKHYSSSTQLLHKAQSTISICLLLLFTTLLVFALSTPPSNSHLHIPSYHRRHLREAVAAVPPTVSARNPSHALQGMGTLYRRGTRAMSDLIVVHSVESMAVHELRLFVRLLYRSSLTSRSDVLFLFPSKRSDFDDAIFQETQYFFDLLSKNLSSNSNMSSSSPWRGLNFDASHFLKTGKKEKVAGEPIWGRKIRANSSEEYESGSTRLSYGSVVGFEAEELDPENALAGFLDHAVPMSLRRWVCYPMLLGRVRHNFKHVVLVDAKEMLLLGDPLTGGGRNQSPETVTIKHVSSQPQSRHGRKTPDKNGSTRAHQGFVMGGSRGIRRLSNAMLTAIVRASPSSSPSHQHKKKISVTESSVFNQLVGNEFALKDVNTILSAEIIPELGSLIGSGSKPRAGLLFNSGHTVVRRGDSEIVPGDSTGDGINYSEHFREGGRFSTDVEAINWAKGVAIGLGFELIISSHKKCGTKKLIRCSRGERYRGKEDELERMSKSNKCRCPFVVIAQQDPATREWYIRTGAIENSIHNHPLIQYPEGHRQTSGLSSQAKKVVEEMTAAQAKPAHILSAMRARHSVDNATIRHVYNYRDRLKKQYSEGRDVVSQLMHQATESGYFVEALRHEETNRLTHVFLAHPESLALLRTYPYFIGIDSTYKTNRYKMPLVEIIGMTPCNHNFLCAFAVMEDETEGSYGWMLRSVRDILGPGARPRLSLIVSWAFFDRYIWYFHILTICCAHGIFIKMWRTKFIGWGGRAKRPQLTSRTSPGERSWKLRRSTNTRRQ